MHSLILAALFIFSPDASTVGSSPRALPSQGRNLETGAVVVGLHALPAAARVACGWYELAEMPPPGIAVSNEYWKVTGYTFNRDSGFAYKSYEKAWRKVKPATYSKMRVVIALKQLGVWPQVKQWIIDQDLYDEYLAAQDFAEDDPAFVQGRAALQAALGFTDAQVREILENAKIK